LRFFLAGPTFPASTSLPSAKRQLPQAILVGGFGRLALEIDPLFVDLAIRRWQTFTGEKAVRERDDVFFEEIEQMIDRPEL